MAEELEPCAFFGVLVGLAEFLRQPLTHGLEVIAGIEAFRNRADILAERFAVAQVRGPREDIDLPARIVDVIFARHAIPRPFEQAAQRIAHHRTATMAHVHRAGRIGRNIFDIDRFAVAHGRATVGVAKVGNRQQFTTPCIGG